MMDLQQYLQVPIIAHPLFPPPSNSYYKKTLESILMVKDIARGRKKLKLSKLEIIILLYTEYGNLEETFSHW
jgi:hypothetical protein